MIIGGRRVEEAKVFDSEAGYHSFHNEDGEAYGSFEVFWDDGAVNEYDGEPRNFDEDGEPVKPGWYWVAGFPGCLWDGEPSGPFGSSHAARADADEFAPD